MSELTLRLADGTLIVLPASLETITTYVLLEQETWFEKEWAFIPRLLKPGMTLIDIGANVGVYSLPLARSIGPEGAVYAYEPAAAPREFLQRSTTLNRLSNLQIIGAAVSDAPRQGNLAHSYSSELHHLGEGEAGEPVSITSLDAEDRVRNWPSVDFVKIDAEGEEQRILEGGRDFFKRHSPLVMFEIKAGTKTNEAIAESFRDMGYGIFRLLPGAPVLVPVERADSVDPYEFNLFAAKPDRASALAQEGWLIEQTVEWTPDDSARAHALDFLMTQVFGPSLRGLRLPAIGSPYGDALAGYAVWRSQGTALAQRYAALRFSFNLLRELCEADPQLARSSSLARAAWDLGERKTCVAALNRVAPLIRSNADILEPFWPPNPRFDVVAPGRHGGQWFIVSYLEQLERASSHSSYFVKEGLNLEWLKSQPFVSAEIERRYLLKQLRAGKRLPVPGRLCSHGPDHINADLWRSGAIPNTLGADL
jgi:FkbM family methyltransferase